MSRGASEATTRRGPSTHHDDTRAERNALVEVDGVLVDHADAAGRHARADRPRLRRPVDAVERVLVVLPQIQGARAERVARTARHADAALQIDERALELGLALDHLLRRIPIRPRLLGIDRRRARPGETLPADADAVAQGRAGALDKVEVA